jgi:hypothetical protein
MWDGLPPPCTPASPYLCSLECRCHSCMPACSCFPPAAIKPPPCQFRLSFAVCVRPCCHELQTVTYRSRSLMHIAASHFRKRNIVEHGGRHSRRDCMYSCTAPLCMLSKLVFLVVNVQEV